MTESSAWLPAWWQDQPYAGVRTTRDWIVDATSCAGVLAVSTLSVVGQLSSGQSNGWTAVDAVAGVAGAAALWLRRRWPLLVAVTLLPLLAVSPVGGLSAGVAGFSLAVHRKLPVALTVGVGGVAAVAVGAAIRPSGLDYGTTLLLALFLGAAVTAWGQFVRARRLLVLSLRDRAERAETEQQQRIAGAQQAERTRIAREMHDVLAHRMSLLSMHAGALAFNPDASPADVSSTAEVIRDSAHQALVDLREVIGVLRDNHDKSTRPLPTLDDLPALVEEAGDQVDFISSATGTVPGSTGRTAYRVVQEALTNARKHAPHQPVRVRLEEVDNGIEIEVRNPRTTGQSEIPGAGVGLIGVAERVRLAGGELTHGPVGGEYVLCVRLPFRP